MVATSPRVDPRLVAAAFVVDDSNQPYAETCRRVGEIAQELGIPRPSYDTIRTLLRVERERKDEIRRLLQPIAGDVLVGRFSPWDVDRIRDAAALAALPRARGRRAS
jgi:hypothetical protein